MKNLELYKEYKYSFLADWASEEGLTEAEFNHQDTDIRVIGESFLTFTDGLSEDVYSFVLTGYNVEGIYRLIYKYTG